MSMDTEESLKEYLSLQLKVPLVARLGPLARTFDFVANAAPGVKEILTIGKFLWEVREGSYDLVVVDAVATGHITGQLAAPQAIQ
jgi:anion-transporting  ArsA/GET3 family ATPase